MTIAYGCQMVGLTHREKLTDHWKISTHGCTGKLSEEIISPEISKVMELFCSTSCRKNVEHYKHFIAILV